MLEKLIIAILVVGFWAWIYSDTAHELKRLKQDPTQEDFEDFWNK